MTAQNEQKNMVFSGVFALVWIGEAVVTMQIKLLGGNMSVSVPSLFTSELTRADRSSNQSAS